MVIISGAAFIANGQPQLSLLARARARWRHLNQGNHNRIFNIHAEEKTGNVGME